MARRPGGRVSVLRLDVVGTTACCAALDCRTPVPAGFALCRTHWGLVPGELRPLLLAARPAGAGPPAPDELDVLRRVVAAVARREGLPYRTTSPRTGEVITSGIDAAPLTLDLGLP